MQVEQDSERRTKDLHELRGSLMVHSIFCILPRIPSKTSEHPGNPTYSWCNIKGVLWPYGAFSIGLPKNRWQHKVNGLQTGGFVSSSSQHVYWPAAVLTLPHSPKIWAGILPPSPNHPVCFWLAVADKLLSVQINQQRFFPLNLYRHLLY